MNVSASSVADRVDRRAEASPRFSILVPAYNVADYLPECLESVLRQPYADFELVAVDDGSQDASPEILARYALMDCRVRVITQANAGVSAARNVALEAARGEYVFFVDPDDYLESDALTRIDGLINQDAIDVVVFGYRAIPGKKQPRPWGAGTVRLEHAHPSDLSDLIPEMWSTHRLLSVWTKVYRRAFLLESGARFPPRRRGQDCLFNFQVLPQASSFLMSGETMYVYRTHLGSATTKPDKDTLVNAAVLLREFERFLRVVDGPLWVVRQESISAACESIAHTLRGSPRKARACLRLFGDADYRRILRKATLADCRGRIRYMIALMALRALFLLGSLIPSAVASN